MVEPKLEHVRGITLEAQLARTARQTPEALAFKFNGFERSYAALEERVTRLANALIERGFGKGDRLAIMMHNSLELIECYLAAGRAGGICVPVNFRLHADEVRYILSQSGASLMIADAATLDVALAISASGSAGPRIIVADLASSHDAEPLEEVLASGSTDLCAGKARDHDPAFIMYTSGTTGRPKGAVLTHFNLFVNTANLIAAIEIMNSDCRWLAGLPLFHIGGLNGILPFIYKGGASVILPTGSFNPEQVVDLLERERITSCFFVPTQWQAICEVDGIERRDLCLERISWGASVAPPSVVQAIHRTFPGVRTYNVFGQTEMSSITTVMRVDRDPQRLSSIGKPVPGIEVRIVDDEMNDVRPGEPGEIVYRGPTVMQGYWDMPEATAAAFRAEWFHSGDLVKADEAGYLYVVDRKTDMVISGGENIYCPEVEAVIDGHRAVREVAVIGAPHPKWIETPVAIISLFEGCETSEGEIIQWCKERLASYKKPTRVHFVASLPRNASGKVLKTQLKQEFGK